MIQETAAKSGSARNLTARPMQESKICEDCGTKVPAQAPACPNCGLSFSAQADWEERVDREIGQAFPLPPEEARHGKAEEVPDDARYMEPAGFWLRFVAIFVDGVLVNVLTYGLIAALEIAMEISGGIEETDAPEVFFFAILFITIVIPMAYFVLTEASSLQGTLGKRLVGIKVTDLAGNRIGVGRATGRMLAKFLSATILYIGFMMAGWTEKKQALHDMVAGTLVVRR